MKVFCSPAKLSANSGHTGSMTAKSVREEAPMVLGDGAPIGPRFKAPLSSVVLVSRSLAVSDPGPFPAWVIILRPGPG